MADFKTAFKKIIFTEGGYANDPDDAGGETYMGISRRAHPNAKIWKYVDAVTAKYKTAKEINAHLKDNAELNKEIEAIYKSNYWNVFNLDNEKSQRLAMQIFDDAVNRGVNATKAVINRVRNEMAMLKK